MSEVWSEESLAPYSRVETRRLASAGDRELMWHRW